MLTSDRRRQILKNAFMAAAESTDTGSRCSDPSAKIRGRRVDALHYAQD
jgi:hypothetical protein